MLKFEAAALQQNGKKLIENLQRTGIVQLSDIEDERLFTSSVSDSASVYESGAQAVMQALETLSEYGIKGLWNFANTELRQIENMKVENVHLGDSLMMLCHALKEVDEYGQ